ncbi:MAG: sulfite exporter TauE/SafE family protein [Actinomycetota bacterium]|nr:sulfite exporter TauE/SafE family protein [Actinomycetota bacterium]
MVEIIALIVLGLFAGAIAASLGLGGGIIFVPALVVLFGFDQHIAQGTSLAVIFPTAIVATIAHTRRGNVRWNLAIPIGIAGIAGAILGALIALRLDPDLLRRLFGAFLLLLAVRMGWRAWRIGGGSKSEAKPT